MRGAIDVDSDYENADDGTVLPLFNLKKSTVEFKTRGAQSTSSGSSAQSWPEGVQLTAQDFIPDFLPVLNNKRRRPNMDPAADSNRYAPLATLPPNATDVPPVTNKKPPPPAPLILHGRPSNILNTTNEIKNIATQGFYIKYTKNNTNIYFTDNKEKQQYQTIINRKNIQYYTYTDRTEKQNGFVLKGLETDATLEELLEELQDENKNITRIYKMNTQRPTYLVTTLNNTTLQDLQTIKHVNYTRVSWERHINKKGIIQCHRCQRWGHATLNCRMNIKCLKCAGEHLTNLCVKTLDVPAKCANCDGAHPANSVTCPVYVYRIRTLEASRQSRGQQSRQEQPRYVPAPLPSHNAWAARAAQQDQQLYGAGPAGRRSQHPLLPTPQHLRAPLLPTPQRQRAPHHQMQQHLPSPQPQLGAAPAHAQAVHSQSTNDLFSEMAKLNSLINIGEMLRAIRDLNALLERAQTPQDKFMATMQFTQNINSYQI